MPSGFPILVFSESRIPVEPVLRYVYDVYNRRPAAAVSVTNDLKDWWAYLREHELEWDEISRDDIRYYGDVMHQTVSPLTHQQYSPKTISKRVGTVIGFYRWAQGKKLIGHSIELPVRNAHKDFEPSPTDTNEDSSDLYPAQKAGPDDHVVALSQAEVASIFNELGPLPSERQVGDPTSRDRLIAELALNTGMRRDEISHTTFLQIAGLRPDPAMTNGVCRLRLRKTKGLRPRTVEVPNWLLAELMLYAKTERNEALEKARKKGRADTLRFFVNGLEAKHNAGFAVSNDTIDRAFRAATMKAGQTKVETCFNSETGTQYSRRDAKFTFHALRHTFAIWRYYAEFYAGVHEPWKIVQALLGHKTLATTSETYLRPSAAFEGQITDTVFRHFKSIRERA